MTDRPHISVIIATYNRAHILGECLESLACQTAAPESFEVIVVDNNSTDNTEEVVSSFADKIPQLCMINETRQGAGHARNAAIAVARGEWIACLDSDGKACPAWVEIILREIKRGNFDCFGGPFRAWHHYGPPPLWFSPDWETSLADFAQYGLLGQGKYPTGGSCAFTKSFAEQLGGFPTEIGMKGTRCAYGEETQLFKGMREAGARLGSVPDMLIDHCVLPYKYTMRWRFISVFALGRDTFLMESSSRGSRDLARQCWHLLKSIGTVPVTVWKGWSSQWPWQRGLLECAAPLLFNAGSVLSACCCLWSKQKF